MFHNETSAILVHRLPNSWTWNSEKNRIGGNHSAIFYGGLLSIPNFAGLLNLCCTAFRHHVLLKYAIWGIPLYTCINNYIYIWIILNSYNIYTYHIRIYASSIVCLIFCFISCSNLGLASLPSCLLNHWFPPFPGFPDFAFQASILFKSRTNCTA